MRKIIHLDLDAFFCAVEEQRNPRLADQPFAVGGKPGERGVVSSCSYAARRTGVRSAMPTARAIQICPGLIILSPNHRLYGEISRKVMERLQQWTALLEKISIDEAFLDLSDLPEPPTELAFRLQKDIQDNLGLPCSLGVATNKLVAKIATDVGKSQHRGEGPPKAITVVPPGEEATFLAPLPVDAMWGIGPKTAARFLEKGIETIGDLARLSEGKLVEMVGRPGHELFLRVRGIDDRPIITEHEAKSISQEVTFPRDVRDPQELEKTLSDLSEKVATHLRRDGLAARVIRIKIRWQDFTTLTRQVTLQQPVDQGEEIFLAATGLFRKVWEPGKAVRLVGIGSSKLELPFRQLSLWDTNSQKGARLQKTLDEIHERYGMKVIGRGLKKGSERDG